MAFPSVEKKESINADEKPGLPSILKLAHSVPLPMSPEPATESHIGVLLPRENSKLHSSCTQNIIIRLFQLPIKNATSNKKNKNHKHYEVHFFLTIIEDPCSAHFQVVHIQDLGGHCFSSLSTGLEHTVTYISLREQNIAFHSWM